MQFSRSAAALLWPCLLLIPAAGCGGRALTKKGAHAAILQASGDVLKDKDVDIRSVTQTAPGTAVVDAELRVGLALQKVQEQWTIKDVKLGEGDWRDLRALLSALEQIQALETRSRLEAMAAAIERYNREHGALPEFHDFVSLTDTLSPAYLSPLIRLDAWRNPFSAYRTGAASIRLVSPGPDGREGTSDDIELTRLFPPPQ